MEYNGYHAKVEFDQEDQIFIGHVLGINDSLNFHGESVKELTQSMHDCIDNYLDYCQKIGKEPEREYKGTFNGVKVYDDYGHHPTEIKATADAINCKQFNQSWVIFQSHTFSRTKEHLQNFAKVLTEFDNIIIAKIYPARETDDLGISGQSIVDEIKSRGKDAIYIPEFDDIAQYIKEHAKPGDLVLTLGAGNVNQIADLLLDK
jgi:UDP-N-acetylmuramate-alanine ligase